MRLNELLPKARLRLICTPSQWRKMILFVDPERFEVDLRETNDRVEAEVTRKGD